MEKQPFYLTTAIPYVNAELHIGHGLLFLYTDVIARYERLFGKEVVFLTGTDEHGQKIARKAEEVGKTPQAFVDEMSQTARDMLQTLNISNTDFIRTTETRHRAAVEAFWKRVEERGWIYKKRYGGLYCVGCEQFKIEKDLVDGLCPDHKVKPEYIEEENYFFKLSAFKDQLLALYAERPDFVVPEHRFNEMKSFVAQLEDMSISRAVEHLTWGIPVPGDSSQVIYVWFDALVNYLSGVGFGTDQEMYERFWPTVTHVLGKEINRFHSVLWVAMLLAAELPVPRQFVVHGWITVEGQKMSKTIGNVLYPKDLVHTFGLDGMRYLLLREFPVTGDGDYSADRMQRRFASDLANDLGNLVFRVTNMVQKYCEGRVPARGARTAVFDHDGFHAHMRTYRFDLALEFVWQLIAQQNRYIDEMKPWALAKAGDQTAVDDALYSLLEALRQVAWLIRPFMPETSQKILTQLGMTVHGTETWHEVAEWNQLVPGTPIEKGEPLFPRLDAPHA
jgi:methionyl-tRNA synthetase